MSIASVCKNGIYVPRKTEDGEWEIACIHDVFFTYSYGKHYFFSPTFEERSFLLEEENKTWFTTYEKALARCDDSAAKIDPIAVLRKYAQVDRDCHRDDPMCHFEGIDFEDMEDDEYDAVLDWLGVEKELEEEE